MEAVLRFEERMKKRDALNVVPMIMRHQDVRLDPHPALFFRQMVAQHAQPGAAIQDKFGPVRCGQFQARRVPAIAPRVALERRRRAAHTPENQFGSLVRHRRAASDAARLRPL